jgi:hypothetical protein
MNVRFHCPEDNCVAIIEYGPIESSENVINCPRCNKELELKINESIIAEQTVDQCVVCSGRELFIKKDFPQFVGLIVVIAAGIAGLIAFRRDVLLAWAILASAVVIDLVLYAIVRKLTVCYACRAEYRGGTLNPSHEEFDLATSEKY